MTIHVNLLPGVYLKRRRHDRRFRAAVLAGCVLLGVELIVGIVVHGRAERTRALYAAADTAKQGISSTKKELEEPRREAAMIGREVHLAERLRTKHRWSRLLATFSQRTPPRVVLTSISTVPPQWTVGLLSSGSGITEIPGTSGKAGQKAILRGVRLTGQAIDHQDLASLMAAIHGTSTFASLELKQARRERVGDQESINFELECHW